MPMHDYGASFNCVVDNYGTTTSVGGGEDGYFTLDYASNDLVALIVALAEEHPECVVDGAHALVDDGEVDDHEVVAVMHLKDDPSAIVAVLFTGSVATPKIV